MQFHFINLAFGKLPTHPSPKPNICPKWEVSVTLGLGEGWVGSFPTPNRYCTSFPGTFSHSHSFYPWLWPSKQNRSPETKIWDCLTKLTQSSISEWIFASPFSIHFPYHMWGELAQKSTWPKSCFRYSQEGLNNSINSFQNFKNFLSLKLDS